MLLRLAKFIIVFAALLNSLTELQASTYSYELEPVKVQADFDGTVKVSYFEPCGTEFAGFLYRAVIGTELKVAVVLRRYHARCTGLMGMQEMTLPLVKADNYAAITSLDPNLEPLQVKSAPIQNLHFTQNLNQSVSHAVYTSQCGDAIGLLVLPEATGMRFGVMEGTTSKPASCNRATKVFSIAGLESSSMNSFRLLQSAQEDRLPGYSLRRVPVQLLTIDSGEPQTTRYQVYYLRRCNEAPIGLVQQNQQGKLQVSMLVAHYETMSCSEDGPKKIWTAFEPGLTIPQKQIAQGLREPPTEELALVRPTSFRWNEVDADKSRGNLEIFTMSSCNRDLGLVSRSNDAGWAVGILQLQSAEPCNSPMKKVSYAYDLELRPQASRDVKPLQLVGT